MSLEYAIGIDIGGTSIKSGLVSAAGEIVARARLPTDERKGKEQLLSKIAAMAGELADKAPSKPVPVGVGTPGFVDSAAGVVTECAGKIPGWKGTPLAEIVSSATALPVYIENDVKVMTLGEGWVGAARGVKNYVVLALGTGVGGGVVIDGQLLQGATGTAATLGHIVVDPEGPLCPCGSRGCLEAYVSTRSIGAKALDYTRRGVETRITEYAEGGDVDACAVFEAARAGDRVAGEIVARAGRYLRLAVVAVINTLDPEMIIIAGGVAKAGEALLKPALDPREFRPWRQPGAPDVFICCSELGDDAGVYGGAALALQRWQATGYSQRR